MSYVFFNNKKLYADTKTVWLAGSLFLFCFLNDPRSWLSNDEKCIPWLYKAAHKDETTRFFFLKKLEGSKSNQSFLRVLRSVGGKNKHKQTWPEYMHGCGFTAWACGMNKPKCSVSIIQKKTGFSVNVVFKSNELKQDTQRWYRYRFTWNYISATLNFLTICV